MSTADDLPWPILPTTDGPEGEFGEPSDSRCCEEKICNCLEPPLKVIAVQHSRIAEILDERLGKLCDKLDECMDELIEKLKERLEKPAKTCGECKAMLRAGLAGTLEYAVQCAGVCEKDEFTVCTLEDPTTEGKRCQGCGQDPCCCYQGECLPCEERERPEPRYLGWCNPFTGQIQVTREDRPRPGIPWVQVALTDTEEAAIQAAEANCERLREPTTTIQPKPVNVPPSFRVACNLLTYQSPSALRSMAGQMGQALRVGGVAQYMNALGDLGVGGITIENIGEIVNAWFKGTFEVQADYIEQVTRGMAAIVGCPDPAWEDLVYTLANLGHVNKMIGLDLSEFSTQYKYAMHAMCRQKYLDPDKAIAAYFGNAIDDSQLDTQWGIHGLCPDALQWYKYAARAKPTPLQAAFLRRRNITDDQTYDRMMRELGYLEKPVRDALFKLTEQYPTMTDIIRLMVRDTDDEAIVNKFGLDTEFDRKYGRKLREWAEFQGIPELVARYQWRAHWQIPAPGQLFEFWHRLRHNPRFGGEEKLLQDIKDALIQQDILPYWHEHFLAVSYRPMFRRDIRRAFQIGAINEEQVRDAYIQLGHSDEVADTLTEFVVRLRDRAVRNHDVMKLWKNFAIDRNEVVTRLTEDGIPQNVIDRAISDVEQSFDKSPYATAFAKGDINRQTFINELSRIGVSQDGASKIAGRVALRINNHPALKGYKAGALTRNDALAQMTSFGMNSDLAMTRLDEIEQELDYALLGKCQNGIKHRYLHGELDRGEAIRELVARGTVNERATKLADEWDCEKSSIGRTIPTSTLCGLLEQGAITAPEFTSRLEKIGYTADNAALLTDDCLRAISERRQKLAERERKDAELAARREAQARARAEAAAKREKDRMARAREKAANVRKRRERQLISAAEKVHDLCNCDLFDAIGAVRLAREHVIRNYGLDIDRTLVVLVKAAEAMEAGDLGSYGTAVDAMATEIVSEPIPLNGNGQAV